MKYRGQRWVRIGLRTIHLVAVVFVGAPVLTGRAVPPEALAVLVTSGAGLLGDDGLRYGLDALRYLSFWAVAAKIALLAIGLARPDWLPGLLVAAIVVGSVISHAPGKVRQWAFVGPPGPCATKE